MGTIVLSAVKPERSHFDRVVNERLVFEPHFRFGRMPFTSNLGKVGHEQNDNGKVLLARMFDTPR